MTRDEILAAVDRYVAEHGKAPNRLTGDASEFFGRPETWLNIDNALRFGLRGLEPGSSLFRFLVDHEYREPPPDNTPMTLAQVREALKAFAADHNGRIPTQVDAGALVAPYLEAPGVTWANLDERLRAGRCGFPGGSSISQVAVEIGIRAQRGVCPPLEEIRAAAQRYFEQHGRLPSMRTGPATEFFGRAETWHRIHTRLKKEHDITLRAALADLVPEGHKNPPQRLARTTLSEESILWAARAFQKDHGRLPSHHSGDATPYFETMGGRLSWRMVNRALVQGKRGLPGGNSLPQLLVQHGLRTQKAGGKPS